MGNHCKIEQILAPADLCVLQRAPCENEIITKRTIQQFVKYRFKHNAESMLKKTRPK